MRAVKYGLMPRNEALSLYALSDEEFDGWMRAVDRHGESALKATQLRTFRGVDTEPS